MNEILRPLNEHSTLPEIRAFLDTIPEKKFVVNALFSEKGCCVLGHINHAVSGMYYDSELEERLREKSREFIHERASRMSYHLDIADVNNGTSKKYPQATPKARSIALIDDMIAAGINL